MHVALLVLQALFRRYVWACTFAYSLCLNHPYTMASASITIFGAPRPSSPWLQLTIGIATLNVALLCLLNYTAFLSTVSCCCVHFLQALALTTTTLRRALAPAAPRGHFTVNGASIHVAVPDFLERQTLGTLVWVRQDAAGQLLHRIILASCVALLGALVCVPLTDLTIDENPSCMSTSLNLVDL
jgi:hypothetical protein